MVCARVSSPSNQNERDRHYYRCQWMLLTWKERVNMKACGTESDLRILKQHRVVVSSTLTTSRHCTQCKSMIHSTDWAFKGHLAWEEERNAAQEEKFWKTIASQGKLCLANIYLCVWVHHSDCITIKWDLCCIKSQSIVWFAWWLGHSTVAAQRALFNLPIKHAMLHGIK